MVIKCQNCPLRGKDLFVELSSDEVKFMEKFKSGELKIDAGTPLLMEGSNSPQLFTALRGMGLRYKLLPDGQRQVINFVFPGDFIGLQAGVMGEMGHSVEATTQMTLCVFDRSEFWNFFRAHPGRAFDLTWMAAVEEHFLGEAMASVGQRSALEAIAWALVRIFQRGNALGLVNGNTMPLPYRQQDMADALGLSLVHTNKTLAKLRDRQLASWMGGDLQINNIAKLAELAKMEVEETPKRPIM
ncbi:Crp/Fnr family transcriptional regulator [Litoreibacter janthinus]|uniref:cAMP-binding domain of CRP or a regulatory subunit of cAMP-dependent protein kinases n=1 Tax=Litoreibacter janthinus TaxID=670154 RepID=A0A1I6GBZ9_9RHOB|nr:Crp/Fnr family transcriptional regulator [Litoreibacter janthinus]SFR39712.1 cAMP-binding domain of CRP or a regulatory subunit of cAMP-dependent protein kinases [Litoreibacter janthinus]